MFELLRTLSHYFHKKNPSKRADLQKMTFRNSRDNIHCLLQIILLQIVIWAKF